MNKNLIHLIMNPRITMEQLIKNIKNVQSWDGKELFIPEGQASYITIEKKEDK